MKDIEKLKELYSGYLFGDDDCSEMRKWGLDRLTNNEDNEDENIILLSTSVTLQESVGLARIIIDTYDTLELLEISDEAILNKIEEVFPKDNPPQKVTRYNKDDPKDYDGEGWSVAEAVQGKSWDQIDPGSIAGYFITYLTADALRYYLPVFLKRLIIDKRPTTDCIERTFYAFSEHSLDKEKMQDIVAMLNCSQKEVILAVLRKANFDTKSYSYECRGARKLLKC